MRVRGEIVQKFAAGSEIHCSSEMVPLLNRLPRDARHLGECEHQGVRAVASQALGLDRAVELFGECEAGSVRPIRRASARAIPMSLMKCSTKKPGSKLPAMIRGPRFESDQLPAAPVATDSQHRVEVEPRLVAVEQRLADADHVGGDQDLVDHLRVLAGAGPPLVDDRLAHRFQSGFERVDTSPRRRRS